MSPSGAAAGSSGNGLLQLRGSDAEATALALEAMYGIKPSNVASDEK